MQFNLPPDWVLRLLMEVVFMNAPSVPKSQQRTHMELNNESLVPSKRHQHPIHRVSEPFSRYLRMRLLVAWGAGRRSLRQ